MSEIEILGGNRLHGEINIQGSKNAVLPIMAATLLNKGVSVIENCPLILDVYYMCDILRELGCKVEINGNRIVVDATTINSTVVSGEIVRKMRSSIIFMGALIGREKTVSIAFPGGCSIGSRPIDLHMKALRKLNIEIKEEEGMLYCNTSKIIGNDIALDFPSVGATENIILATVCSEGTTRIIGAAKEPEIIALAKFLNQMGANIKGVGTDNVEIIGVKKLNDVVYKLPTDRIVAGTYMAAVAAAGGSVTLVGAECRDLYSVVMTMMDIGCTVLCKSDYITVSSSTRPSAIDVLRTSPHPGFPTDMQSQILSVMSIAKGTSVIIENIFEARYKNVGELLKMGADIVTEGKTAVVKGVPHLTGTTVYAADLRGGAALVLAGVFAQGKTIVKEISYITRGYEDIVRDFKIIGANIRYINEM